MSIKTETNKETLDNKRHSSSAAQNATTLSENTLKPQ